MTATERDRRRREAQRLPWWQRPKDRQKADIETDIRQFLELDRDLTDREMYFLAEALNAVDRGLFGIAVQAILNAREPEISFSLQNKIPPDDLKRNTKENLAKALHHLEARPVQAFPIFGPVTWGKVT
jgi:hypothetical protein